MTSPRARFDYDAIKVEVSLEELFKIQGQPPHSHTTSARRAPCLMETVTPGRTTGRKNWLIEHTGPSWRCSTAQNTTDPTRRTAAERVTSNTGIRYD